MFPNHASGDVEMWRIYFTNLNIFSSIQSIQKWNGKKNIYIFWSYCILDSSVVVFSVFFSLKYLCDRCFYLVPQNWSHSIYYTIEKNFNCQMDSHTVNRFPLNYRAIHSIYRISFEELRKLWRTEKKTQIRSINNNDHNWFQLWSIWSMVFSYLLFPNVEKNATFTSGAQKIDPNDQKLRLDEHWCQLFPIPN